MMNERGDVVVDYGQGLWAMELECVCVSKRKGGPHG